MNSPEQWQGKSLQLHGYVVPGSIFRARTDSLEWKFKVESKGSMVDAAYHGIMPDTFKDEAEVVLKGRLTSAGFQVHRTASWRSARRNTKPSRSLPNQPVFVIVTSCTS